MLIYEKRIKEEMQIVIPKDIIGALACDGSAITRAENHLFHVFPHLKEQLIQNPDSIKYNQEKDEHTVFVAFNSAKRFVPNTIYKQV